MSTKQFKELKNLSETELKTRLRETDTTLFKLRMQKVTGQLENTASLWKTRKDIARIKTLLAVNGKSAPAKKTKKAAAKH